MRTLKRPKGRFREQGLPMLFEKHFTLDEARSWLPTLRERFAEIHALYREMDGLRADYERVLRVIRSNGNAPKTSPFEERAASVQERVQKIRSAGIEIKDLERGLVDFPAWRDGQEVLLCWELGEDDIRFWHTPEGGYASRQPLDEG